MITLSDKHVLVGVGGGISAYRTLELIRLLKKHGASVRPAPTRSALHFVTELSLEALSGSTCLSKPLQVEGGIISHIEEAYRANLMVVAPATCDLLAKMAHGMADEVLLQTLLSFQGPVIVAPAMETHMWQHPATQENVATLQKRGVIIVGPAEGDLASGRTGIGRMAEPAKILEEILYQLAPKDYVGKRVIVTAGPTLEEIDPVRFISNYSSGKMGVALARAFAHRGAQVHLVHGPLQVAIPKLNQLFSYAVKSAEQMFAQTMKLATHTDIAVLCAAVADFRPVHVAKEKIKKADHPTHTLELEKNPDILASLGQLTSKPFLVGFAAETSNIITNAVQKCQDKGADLICANDVSDKKNGFLSDTNAVIIVNREAVVKEIAQASKDEVADRILDVVLQQVLRY